VFHADGQTDMSKLTEAFRNFAKSPINHLFISVRKDARNVEILLITNKSLSVASSWSHLYLLTKDARSFEHKESIII